LELLSGLLVVPGLVERIGHHRDDVPVVGLHPGPNRDPGRWVAGVEVRWSAIAMWRYSR
jgi:hypothetical protein